MIGGANRSEAVMQYTHTYQASTGSIDVSASGAGAGIGYTLSNTPKQWDISCVVNNIPY